MDLSTFDLKADSEKGARLELFHPALWTPLGVFIHVLGPDSERARQAQADIFRDVGSNLSQDQLKERSARYAAKLTVSWDGVEWEGKPLEFSFDNAVMIYTKQEWVRQQVDKFQADRANFFNASPQDSKLL